MKNQFNASAGALLGASLLLIFGVLGPILWALYLAVAIGLVQPRRTRSFGIGMWTALLAVATYIAVRSTLGP